MNANERQAARLLLTGAVGFVIAAEGTHERSVAHPDEPEHWPAKGGRVGLGGATTSGRGNPIC